MPQEKLILIAGALFAVFALVSVRVARRRGDSSSKRSGCVGCIAMVLFALLVTGAIVRGVHSVRWQNRANSIDVTAVDGIELFAGAEVDEETTGMMSGTESVEYSPPTFSADATPRVIIEALFPGMSLVDVKTQGMTTAESPEGHWVGRSLGVVLRAPDGTIDSMVLFLKTVAESPAAGLRVAVVRARRGAERFVSAETVGIDLVDSSYLDRFLRMDEPPRLTLEVRVGPTPEALRSGGQEPKYVIDAIPPK